MRLGWRWALWLLIVALCAAGLRNYRVDNGIDQWMPNLAAHGAGSFVIVGGLSDASDADALAQDLDADPAVSGCLSPGAAPMLEIDPLGLLISQDGRYAGVICFAEPGVDDAAFLAAVRRHLPESAGALALAGPPVFRQAVNQASQERLNLVMALIAVVGTLLTWATVGNLRLALMSVTALLSAQVALLGAISWLHRPIDMTLSMVPPLMMALGFSYAAHHLLRRGAVVSLVLCGATTLLGIGSFAFTPVAPVQHFAVAGVVGLLVTWLAVVLLTPAAGALERPSPACDNAWQRAIQGLDRLLDRRSRWVVALALVATILGFAAVYLVRIETNPLHYFQPDARIVHDYEQLNDRLTGMLPSMVEVSGELDAATMLRATDGVRYVLSLGQLSPTEAGRYLVMADQGAMADLARAQDAWQGWAQQQGVSLRWTGVAAQLHGMGRLVLFTAISSLPVMMAVIVAVLGWITRKTSLTVVGLWVNVAPIGAVLLAAAAMDWPMGLPTLMIGAITLGVAVDDTIHLALAWREHRDWRAVLRHNLRACAGSSIIAACCLALFGLCPFVPTSQFGIMLSLAILAALAGDLLVFMAWLRLSR
jgi:predicted RND superfamily exporter protein